MHPEQQLRDIRGLDAIPWWPPGPGWWVLLAIVLLVLLATLGWWLYRKPKRQPPARWGAELLQRLEHLAQHLPPGGSDQDTPHQGTARTWLLDYLELLRQIAILGHGRAACAGLWGEPWLDWLTAHDPSGFDWRRYRAELVDMPYAPTTVGSESLPTQQLRSLIGAARRWIEHWLASADV